MIAEHIKQIVKRARTSKESLFFLVLGIIYLGIPLLKNAHIESAAVSTVIASLWVLYQKKAERRFIFSGLSFVYVTLIPLLLSDAIRGCFSIDGFLFWLVIPLPSLLLSNSIRNSVQNFSDSKNKEEAGIGVRVTSVMIFLFVALGIPVIELKLNPAVFLYNSIWGYWPGPIYDEQIIFPIQLLIHRFYVVIWAVLLWEITRKKQELVRIAVLFTAISLLFLNFRQFGILRTQNDLRQILSTHLSKENINLYIDSSVKDSLLLKYYLETAVFHFEEIQSRLKTTIQDPVSIYLYKHPWQKKQLIGAKYTQFTPVWSNGYQLHIDVESWDDVFRHEMVHLIAKSFSNSLIGASLNLGITEGLATALNPKVSERNTLDEFVAAGGIPPVDEMKSLFTLSGFYLQSSANAYYKSGSFIQYLINNESVDAVKEWYAEGSFKDAFNKQEDELIENWQTYLKTFPIDSVLKKTARKRFAQPSLFNQDCPRFIHPGYALWDKLLLLKAEKDSSSFRKALFSGNDIQDSLWNSFYQRQIFLFYLNEQQADSALLVQNETQIGTLLWSDALLLSGKKKELTILNIQKDSLFKSSNIRSDSTAHKIFCKLWYNSEFPELYDSLSPDLIELAMIVAEEENAYSEINKIQQVIDRVSDTAVLHWLVFLQKRNERRFVNEAIQLLESRTIIGETERRWNEIKRFEVFRENVTERSVIQF